MPFFMYHFPITIHHLSRPYKDNKNIEEMQENQWFFKNK